MGVKNFDQTSGIKVLEHESGSGTHGSLKPAADIHSGSDPALMAVEGTCFGEKMRSAGRSVQVRFLLKILLDPQLQVFIHRGSRNVENLQNQNIPQTFLQPVPPELLRSEKLGPASHDSDQSRTNRTVSGSEPDPGSRPL